ncbi:MAG: hypothetical protein GY869_27275 [Planctomycetes bacterium]|nr:hypothetical protein [Planctomycetota bacterium]
MILLTGSCDAAMFAVNRYAYPPKHSGVTVGYPVDTQVGWTQAADTTHLQIWNAKKSGVARGWDFQASEFYNPEIWCIVNSSGAIQSMWESEDRVDELRSSLAPIISVNRAGTSIIPSSGALIQAQFPTQAIIESIETLVNAASLPNWITGTRFAEFTTTADLLVNLWMHLMGKRGLRMRPTISDVYEKSTRLTESTILWLRAASMILNDHRGETLIPMMKSRCSVDPTTGEISL